jgi:phage-related protein
MMSDTEKPLIWIASSYKDLMELPNEIKRGFGYALSLAQSGLRHPSTKILRGFGGSGVIEVIETDEGGTYRAIYTVKFEQVVFVLHCFQKKSKKGIATPKEDMDLVNARLKMAAKIAKELEHEEKNDERN